MTMRVPICALALVAGLAAPAGAASLSVMTGDDDCFGGYEPGACAVGFFSAVPAPFDNATASDPAGTDTWGALGNVALSFSLALGGATLTSAEVEVRLAGVDWFFEEGGGWVQTADDRAIGMDIDFNGTFIGAHYHPPEPGTLSQRRIATLTFALDPASIAEGANILLLKPDNTLNLGFLEQYAVDYAKLTLITGDAVAPQVPLPAAGILLLGAAGALAALGRRSRTGRAAQSTTREERR